MDPRFMGGRRGVHGLPGGMPMARAPAPAPDVTTRGNGLVAASGYGHWANFAQNLVPPDAVLLYRLVSAEYTNVAGARGVLLNLLVGSGRTLVVQHMRPIFATVPGTGNTLIELDDPYAMTGLCRFDVTAGNSPVGNFSADGLVGNWAGPGIAVPWEDLSGLHDRFALYVRGGQALRIEFEIRQATGVGDETPNTVLFEVGGFYVPGAVLDEAQRATP